MTDNMELWNKVCQTDPETTKHVNQRGGFTAIDAHSQVQRATEIWGPFGSKWGTRNELFTFLEAVSIITYQAIMFYPAGEEPGCVPLHSSIVVKTGDRIDGDCVKKVATDALTKGLSKLGFNADVFLGLYDDNKYVAEMKKKFSKSESPMTKKQLEEIAKMCKLKEITTEKDKKAVRTKYGITKKTTEKQAKEIIVKMNKDFAEPDET